MQRHLPGPRDRAASARWRETAERLARYERQRAAATEQAFDDARDDARKRLIAVALGAGIVIVLLLVTAATWRAWRSRASGTCAPAPMTDDIFLTLSLLLSAALVARLLASVLPVPEILVLVAVGALLGDSALDVVDVPLDSLGAQLLFTLGVSLILFYGGLNLSLPVLRRVWIGLGLLVVPGVVLTAAVVSVTAHLVFDLDWTAALLMGAVLAPTDPAILIPLFVRSRLRPKVAQTVVAESAFNDPTGAALALAHGRRAAQRRRLARRTRPRTSWSTC